MVVPFFSLLRRFDSLAGPEEAKNSREKDLRRFQIRLVMESAEHLARLPRQLGLSTLFELHHILPTRTMKRFASPRCVSAIQMVRARNRRLRVSLNHNRRLLKLREISVTHLVSRSSTMAVFQNSSKYPRRAAARVSPASASVPESSLCPRPERHCLSHWRIAHRRLR
jgi:hypothetical protein